MDSSESVEFVKQNSQRDSASIPDVEKIEALDLFGSSEDIRESVRRPSVISSVRPKHKFWQVTFNKTNAERFATSHLVSPKVLFAIRIFLFLYCTAVLLASLIDGFDHGSWFRYLTNISYLIMYMYFCYALYMSYSYLKRSTRGWNHTILFVKIFWVIYEISIVYKFIIPLVYWVFLRESQPNPFQVWLNVSTHGMDLVVMLIDFVLNRQIMSFGHIYFMIGLTVTYVLTQIIWYAFSRNWTYDFLNITDIKAAYFYPGFFVLFIVVWTLMYFLHLLKERLAFKFIRRKPDSMVTESILLSSL